MDIMEQLQDKLTQKILFLNDLEKEIIANQEMIESIYNQAEELNKIEGISIDVRIDMSTTSIDMHVAGDIRAFKGAWQILRNQGYEPSARPESHERLSAFNTYWNKPEHKLKVWFNFTSSVCKRIQVGTKTVEEPIYEVICDDSPAF